MKIFLGKSMDSQKTILIFGENTTLYFERGPISPHFQTLRDVTIAAAPGGGNAMSGDFRLAACTTWESALISRKMLSTPRNAFSLETSATAVK
jgi:hypothetical protein